MGHVSPGPPLIPDGRISRVRLAAVACPQWPFPTRARLKRSLAYAPAPVGLTTSSTPSRGTPLPGSVSGRIPLRCPPPTENPFARRRARLAPEGLTSLRPALPGLPRSYGLMRRTIALSPPPVPLGQWVFAGCCEPLLGGGPSRRYLRNPCAGAWTRTPPFPSGAFARFFPDSIGLTFVMRGSTPGRSPQRNFYAGERFRGCSHSLMFRLPHLLGLLVAPTTAASRPQERRGRLRHAMDERLPARPVVSLHACAGQFAWRDLHPLDCGLVGRYT